MKFTADALAREIADLKRRLRGVEGASAMRFRSVEGGAIAIHDNDGNPVTKMGLQDDGETYSVGYNIGETQITDEAITTPKLAANAVTADKIEAESVGAKVGSFVKVNASQINTGTLSATVTLSGKVQTAATGARSTMDSSGFKSYDAAGNRTFDTSGGNVFLVGSLSTLAASGAGVVLKPGAATSGEGQSVAQFFTNASSETGPSEIYAQSMNGYPSLKLLGGSVDGKEDPGSRASIFLGFDPVKRRQIVTNAEYIKFGGATFGVEFSNDVTIGANLNLNGGKMVLLQPPGNYATNFIQSPCPVRVTGVGTSAGQDIQGRAFVADTLVQTPQIQTASPDTNLDVIGGRAILTLGQGWVQSPQIYTRTYTGAANVYVTASGTLGFTTSRESYKVAVDRTWADTAPLTAIKQLTPATYYDKGNTERYNDLVTKYPPGFIGPLPNVDAEFPTQQLGLIAEDVAASGLHALNTYDDKGDVMGVAYDRVAVALIPWLREHESRIEALETENTALTARLEALEARLAAPEQ